MPTTSRGYPYPNPSDPADVPSDMQALATAIDGDMAGITPYIDDNIKVANTTSASTTEVVIDSMTWTAVANEKVLLHFDAAYQGSIVGDILELRMRYKAGASVDATGTSFGILRVRVEVANSPVPVDMARVATGIAAGQTTIGVLMNRASGTGTITVNGSATSETAMNLLRVLSP